MIRCPLTYDEIEDDQRYSLKGLRKLAPTLTNLKDFPYTAAAQIQEARARASKLSLQGVQPKLSARLAIKAQTFELINRGGTFILKPQHHSYPQLPENEDLSMRLAAISGLDVPLHGLFYAIDGTFTYFIKRFDRYGHGKKRQQEDFAQLLGKTRDTKYNGSMEQAVAVVDTYCTFPAIEKVKLFKITLFSFLIGNEDLHLKNFSLLIKEGVVALSPAYDLLNSTIYIPKNGEELALPLKGKKRNIAAKDLLDYFARERLNLQEAIIETVLSELLAAFPKWRSLIAASFLSKSFQEQYLELINNRVKRIGLSFL